MAEKRNLSAMGAFLQQLEQQKNCDVTFKVKGKTIGAHKFCLEARSDVFKEMLENWTPEKGPIAIDDLSYDIFQQILRYIYSDEITVTNNNVIQFRYAAQHFQMGHLEARCNEFILQQLEQQKNCDVAFKVEDKTIGAHKFCLEARSDVFQEMLENWTPEKGPIAIDDLSYDIFQQILRYIYSDDITVTNNNVFHFLYAAQHFQMDHLEARCTEFIDDILNTDNIYVFLNEAVNFEAVNLKNACSKKFQQIEFFWFWDAKSFLYLSQPALSALLDVEETQVLEIDLFFCVQEWMIEQCKRQGISENGTNMRKVLGNALYKIRFPTMTVYDFSNYVANIEGFLDDTEVAQIYKKITICDNENINCAFSYKLRCVDSDLFNSITDLLKQEVLHIYGTWCTASHQVQTWTSYSVMLHRTLLQLLMQCSVDSTNSSLRKNLVVGYISSTIKKDFETKFTQWIASENSQPQTTMNQFLELRKILANLPE